MLRGAAHITGGGITDNTPRMLPKGLAIAIDTGAWRIPPLFEVLRRIGNIPEDDYRRTFNLGIGMILAVPARGESKADRGAGTAGRNSHSHRRSGRAEAPPPAGGVSMNRLGILISGRGSNFEAIARERGRGRDSR